MKFLSKLFNSSKHSSKDISLKISSSLQDFVKDEILPGLDISPHYFWSSFENLLNKFSDRNIYLLFKIVKISKKWCL